MPIDLSSWRAGIANVNHKIHYPTKVTSYVPLSSYTIPIIYGCFGMCIFPSTIPCTFLCQSLCMRTPCYILSTSVGSRPIEGG